MSTDRPPNYPQRAKRSKTLAALLAIFLGGIGAHKFYLGKVGWGIVYLIFSWTSIPIFVGILEGIIYLCMSDSIFECNYS